MAFLPNLVRAVTGRPSAKAAAPYALQSYYSALSEHYGRLTRDWPIERAVTEGYDRVIWVFKSVNTIGQDQSRLPFLLRQGTGEKAEVIEDHPLARLLNKKANQLETGQVFRKRLSAQILLSKRGAFVEVTKSNRGTPIRLDLLPPDRVEIVPGRDSLVDHYRLTLRTGGYRNIDPEKVRWFRDPHPIDPYSGVTPLESMGMSVELDHFARLYNVTFMSNDGRPGGVLAVRDTKGASADIDPRIMNRIEERFGKGPQEAGKLSVIAGELSYVDTAASPRDSQYTEASRNAKIEILSGFGIGESVLGYAAERTFDNADNELYVYWTRTMPGHLDIITTGFDEDSEDDVVGEFDTSGVEVLERAARERRKEAREEVAAGLRSIYDYAQIADIETIESTPHTRALYVPSGKTPLPAKDADAAALGMAQPEETPGGALPGGSPEPAALPPGQEAPAALAGPPAPGSAPGPAADEAPAAPPAPGAARAALDAVAGRKSGLRLIEGGRPKALTSSAQRKDSDQAESALDLDAVAVLEESLTHVLTALTGRWLERTEARLNSPKQRKNTRHWTPEYEHDTRIGTKALDAARAVDAETWEEEAQEQTHPVLTAAAIAAAAAILADLHVVPPVGSTLVDMARRIVMLGVEQVVSSIARAAGAQALVIADDLNRADQDGEDFDAILHRLHEHRDRMAGWARRLAGWAAYAGTNGARDDGAREANRDESIEIARAWFTRRDDKVRPSHHAADGQVRGLDEPFVVGGSLLRYPGDPLAPIGETANCRCWLRYRSKRTGRWVPTPDTKFLRPRDGDGDGFVDDGTPMQRPAPPPLPVLPVLPDPSPALTENEGSLLSAARLKSLVDLRDGKGPVEAFLRKWLDRIGVDPYDVDLDVLHKHADQHARDRAVAGNRQGESRYWFKSPCWALRDVDYAVHVILPQLLRGRHPELARKLSDTSPRWKIDPDDFAAAMGMKALPRDGDGDGLIDDGTPRERPAPVAALARFTPDAPRGFTPGEVAALRSYQVVGYRDVNAHLRTGESPEYDDTPATIAALDGVMARSRTDAPATVYRGLYERPDGMVPGAEFLDLGYASTSYDEDYVRRIYADAESGGMLLRIHVPPGVSALRLDQPASMGEAWQENELLLARGARFRVLSETPGDGDLLPTVFDVEVVW